MQFSCGLSMSHFQWYDMLCHLVIDMSLLGLTFYRSDSLREVEGGSHSHVGFRLFLLILATSKSQDFVERVRPPLLERTGIFMYSYMFGEMESRYGQDFVENEPGTPC
jgi:hypothetical protein